MGFFPGFFRILALVQCVLAYILEKVSTLMLALVYDGSSQKVGPTTDEILLMPAIEIASQIRQRKVRCEDVMNRFIRRILHVNPLVNAIAADRYEAALDEARQLDSLLDSPDTDLDKYSDDKMPFLGVPFTAKEAFHIKGMPNTAGLVKRKHIKATSNADTVDCLIRAGAIPLATTNCSELCMWWESNNRVYGRTSNPYNTSRIAGGSSGGEACLIACAGSVIGIGSDIGGSIRLPSFFCGIFGHKPTTGIVSNGGQFPDATAGEKRFLVTGPMCRFSVDILPLFKVMAGEERVRQLKLNVQVNLKEVKFYTMEDDGGCIFVCDVDGQLKQAQKKVIERLEGGLGIKVTPINISKMKLSVQIWTTQMSTSGGAKRFCKLMGQGQPTNPYKEFLKWLMRSSDHTLPALALGMSESLASLSFSASSNKKIASICDKLEEELQAILGGDGVLLYPSQPRLAPYHNQPILMPFNFAYTGIFNVLGVPVTQCPVGLSTEGLPMGVQVVGAQKNDRLTIAVANEISRIMGGWVPHT